MFLHWLSKQEIEVLKNVYLGSAIVVYGESTGFVVTFPELLRGSHSDSKSDYYKMVRFWSNG